VSAGHKVTYLTREHDEGDHSWPFKVIPIWRGDIYDSQGKRTPAGAVSFSWSLFRYLRRNRDELDAVIVSSTPTLNLLAAAGALVGSRTVIVADWLEVWHVRKWMSYSGLIVGFVAFATQTLALRVGHILTTISQFTRSRILIYLPKAQVITVGLIDLGTKPHSGQKSLAGAHQATQSETILFVGRHIADKQIDLLIRAMFEKPLQGRALCLQIVGSGPETEALRSLAETAGGSADIHFLGRVSDEDLDVLMSSAAVLANPSRREGFGLVIAEAAQWGTPSVVIDEPDNAAKDLIVPGVNGFIAGESSAIALATAIAEVLDSLEGLRRTTFEWFNQSRAEQGLEVSVREIIKAIESSHR
jgi:glycosyltransferase involved in cell wall biosynthesis